MIDFIKDKGLYMLLRGFFFLNEVSVMALEMYPEGLDFISVGRLLRICCNEGTDIGTDLFMRLPGLFFSVSI
jgi:hypothetical protein